MSDLPKFEQNEPAVPTEAPPWRRRVLMLAVVVAIFGLGRATGLLDAANLEAVRAGVEAAGWLAVPAYLLVFVAAVSLAVPGMVVVVAGLLAFGPVVGAPLAVFGSGLAGTFATWWLGRVGGPPVGPPRGPVARRVQEMLGRRPLLAVALVRFVARMALPSNMLLAVAGVRPVHNFVGTMLGMAPKVLVVALFLDEVVAWMAD